MDFVHALDSDELPSVHGAPTQCADIVPAADTTERAEEVTCPACLAVVRARSAGTRARHAISLGEASGLFGDAAMKKR